jgi:hypothetical protein
MNNYSSATETRATVHVAVCLCIAWYTAFGFLPLAHASSSLSLPIPSAAGADTPGPALKYETDQRVYKRGDVVRITVTNVSDVATPIVDRAAVDGEFAVLEIKTEAGEWKPVELHGAGSLVSFRDLAPGDHHEYLWPTSGHDGSLQPPNPGTYRIGFGRPFYTNSFELDDK